MKCFYHLDQEAVAQCQYCGKGLCHSCAAKYTPCLCDDCYEQVNASAVEQAKSAKKEYKRERSARRRNALAVTTKDMLSASVAGFIVAAVGVVAINYSQAGAFTLTALDWFENLVVGFIFFCVPFGWRVISYLEQWLPGILMTGPIALIYIFLKLSGAMIIGIPVFLIWLAIYLVKLLAAALKR